MKNILEKCINIMVFLFFACLATFGTCGVIKLVLMLIEHCVKEKLPTLEVVATGSIFLMVIIIIVTVVMVLIHSWLDE